MTSGRRRVLVLYGGRSAEHEISILSARYVMRSLDPSRYQPLCVAIGRDGRWHLQDERSLPTTDDPRAVAIDAHGARAWLEPIPAAAADRGEHPGALRVEGRAPEPFDVVFPVLHGPMGEDGTVQGLFELAGVPYVGAGVAASALGMDKALQKQLLEQAGLPVVPHRLVRAAHWARARASCLETLAELGGDVFVKPANMGSSLGIGRARGAAEMEAAVDHALGYDTKVIVERALEHPREIECSVLGNDDAEVSLPGEIVVEHPDGFYSYDAKYVDDGARLLVPARLSPLEVRGVQLAALRAFRALDCAGMARVDMFLVGEVDLYLNELNTIPGFTAISMYPRLWEASGLPGPALVDRLVELALERHAARARLRTSR
jgi:D-alanine-D-alanine ligase